MRSFVVLLAAAGLALGQTPPVVLPPGSSITVVGQTGPAGPPGKDGASASALPAPNPGPTHRFLSSINGGPWTAYTIDNGDLPAVDLSHWGMGGIQGLLDPVNIKGGIPSASSGASQSGQLADLRILRVDATHATVGAACTVLKPCNVRFNESILSLSTQAAVSLSGPTSGALTLWIDGTGAYFVGYPLGTTIACQGCTAVQATSVPEKMVTLGTINFATGAFNSDGVKDLRAVYGRDFVIPGFGLVGGPNGSLGVDGTLFAQFTPAPAASSAACTPPMWSYDSQYIYVCVAPNSWRRMQTGAW